MNQPAKSVEKTIPKKQAKGSTIDSIRGKFDGLWLTAAVVLFVLSFFFAGSTLGFIAGKSIYVKILFTIIGVAASLLCLYLTAHWPYVVGLVKGARIELRKVHWPSKDEWTKSTIMVLVLVSIFAIMLMIIDWFIALIIRQVI